MNAAIQTVGIAALLVAAWCAVSIVRDHRRAARQTAAGCHHFGPVTHGQMCTVHCSCGQSFTAMTEHSARMSWLKHRRQETS